MLHGGKYLPYVMQFHILFSDANELQLCLFEESLVAIAENGQTVGTFSISVQWAQHMVDGWQDEYCYLVCARSQGTIDDVPCKTSITGNVTVVRSGI